VIDGADAARFTTALSRVLADRLLRTRENARKKARMIAGFLMRAYRLIRPGAVVRFAATDSCPPFSRASTRAGQTGSRKDGSGI
jgi:hypothetical protein